MVAPAPLPPLTPREDHLLPLFISHNFDLSALSTSPSITPADLLTFTQGMNGSQAIVALSTGAGFGTASVWATWFAPPGEVPAVGRFNNDSRADILTFTRSGAVYIGASNGSNNFAGALWHSWFGDFNDTLLTGDVNGNGRDDLVAFTQVQTADVWVSLSNGAGFGATTLAHSYFAP